MLQPKNTNGLSKSDNDILVKELTNYAEDGATEEQMKEFRDTFISTKKKSTASSEPAATPQKSASVPATGSSGLVGQNNTFGADLPSQAKSGAIPATKKSKTSKYPEGSMAWNQERMLASDPAYRANYDRFKQAEIVPEDRVNAIRQEVEDEANNEGFYNAIKSGITKFATMMPSFLGGISEKNNIPLYEEREQAKKELQKLNLQARNAKKPEQAITEESVLERAKQIKVKKRLDSERNTQVREFLEDAENSTTTPGGLNERQKLLVFQVGDKSTLDEKDKMLLKKQNILRPAIESSATLLKAIQKDAAEYTKNGQPVPDDLKEQYEIARDSYQKQLKDAIVTQREYVGNQINLGSAVENLDNFKRDYSWGKNFENNVLSSTMDLVGGAIGAGDYINTVAPGISPTSKSNALQFRSLARKYSSEAQEVRDEVMKPVSVDDINSLGDFGKFLANTAVAQQIPIFLAVSTGAGGIAALGASATGQKFEEMQSEDESGESDYSDLQMAGIPLAFGATETASALIDGMLLKNAARTIRSATAPERKLMAEGFWEQLKNGASKLSKDVLKGTAIEASDEAGTQIAQNLIDIYAGDKKDVGVFDNVKDAAAAGGILGAFIPFGGNIVSKAVQPFSTDDAIQKSAAEIQKFESLLGNPELNETTRSVIEKQLTNAEASLETNLKKTVSNIEKLSDEDFQRVISLEKEQARLREQGNEIKSEPSIDEDTRDMLLSNLKADLDTNNEKRLAILNKPANEQKPNEVAEQTSQSQAEKQAPVNQVTDVNDTNVANIPQSNNSQISNPNNSEASQVNLTEIPNPNQTNNESSQGDNIAANDNIRSGTAELGEMGETGESAPEAVIGEGAQSTAEPGASESQPEVNQQDNVNYALSELDKGVTLWNGNPYSTRINLGIPWSDIRKGEQDLRAGKINSVPAQRLTEALIAARDKGEYDFIEGSGSLINRFRMPIQDVINTQQEELTAEELETISSQQESLAKEADEYLNTLSDEELDEIFGYYEQEESGEIGENATGSKSENDVSDKEKSAERAEGTYERKPGKKSVVNRLYEGETSDTVKAIAEKSGLTYEVENQEQAQKKAKAFVDEAGINNALEAVRTGVIKGAEAAFVYAEILDKIQEVSDNTEPTQRAKVEEQYLTIQNEATNLFDQQARDSGRFIAALNRVYNTAKIKYNLSRQIERYKAANNGEIDEATMEKFKAADAKLKELEKQLAEAEKRAEEAEQKAAMQNIVESIEREAGKKPVTNRQKAKKVANNIRKLKITRPDAFNAATAGVIWDAAIEIAAKTIETGGTVADGINKAIAYIKKTKWYKGLSEDRRTDAENQFRNSVLDSQDNNVPKVTVEDGVIFIPEAVIRNLVESGIKDIDSLAQAILDTISEAHPEITLRDVRDAITKYGKTANPTKDDLLAEINQMKRLGRLISGLEDVESGQRPLRSGLQREKPSQEERKLQRELREKMRDLPLDHADLEKQWKNALDTVKSRLNNQIEDLEKQIEAREKRKPERTSIQYDQEALDLKNRRDELRDILDEIAGKPELTDEQRVQRAINITEAAIEKLRKQIESGDIGFNPTPRTLSSPELDALKATRKALSEQVGAMRNEAGIIEARKLKQAKDRINKRIKELQDKIASRDYSKKESKPIKADEELIKLQAEKIRVQEIYDRAAYELELKNRSFREKSREAIVGALNIFRILKATGELSPVLIQGGIQTVNLAVRKPKVLLKALAKLFIAFGSSRKAEQYDATMKANPNYGAMKVAKLGLVEPDYKLDLREEQFIGNYINNIWNFLGKGLENASGKIFNVTETMPLGDKVISFFNDEYKNMPKTRISEQFKNTNPLLALERGLTTYMNELRMERFNDGAKMLEMEGKNISDNKKDYEKLAAAINSLTGRANIGRLTGMSDILNTIFFSFRNTVSIINQINPYWYATLKSPTDPWYKPSVAQKVAVYDMIRFITITTSMMYLLKAAAGDDEEGKPIIDIETDPRSSDFMKMRQGNIRFDAFHGMLPMVTFFARQFTGKTKTKGEVKDLGSGNFTPTRTDLLVNMGANKLSPQAGIAYRFGSTKLNKKGERVNKFGEEYDLGKELDLTPIYINSLQEIAKEDPEAVSQFLTFMGVFGVNSSVYETKKASKPSGKKLPAETQRRVDEAKKRAQEALKNR